ncbi:MAG: IS66 family transposase zinc-finger binding domain-containing protein [Chlamydiales bacterium]|nr:IS66 family transposase zinc-finger binding domain-containing protein [Chlamydiales bacterium]
MTAPEAISYEEVLIKNIQLEQENIYLKKQLEWFRKYLFGKKSERNVSQVNAEQLTFAGFEVEKPQEEVQDVPAHKRKKPNRKGEEAITLPPDLPVEQTILDLPEEKKVCPETGEKLVKIGEEVNHKLAFKPGSYFIKEIIRPKYAHPQKEEAGIFTAELPSSIIPKCRAEELSSRCDHSKICRPHAPLPHQ